MMPFRKVLIALILLTFVSCNTATKPNENDALVQELTDSLVFLSKTADFNGFGVAVVGPQGVLYANGFGLADVSKGIPYTERTVQPIASISKTFIGLAVLKAEELGKLKLDDPVSKFLPFPVINPHHPEMPITMRHLVTHTSTLLDKENYLFRSWILRDTLNLAQNLALDIGECRFSAPTTAVSMEEFLRRYLSPDGPW